MIAIKNEDGTQVDIEELKKHFGSWIALEVALKCSADIAKDQKIDPAKIKIVDDQMVQCFAAFVGMMVQFCQEMNNNMTPHFVANIMMSTLFEFSFSSMIAEKQQLGEEIATGDLPSEFMQNVYEHASNVMSRTIEKINDGTFEKRVISQMEQQTNAPSTLTRQ